MRGRQKGEESIEAVSYTHLDVYKRQGLIKAVDTFDPARRVRFASYASQCIENEMRMYLRHARREGTPLSLQEPLESSGNDSGTLTLADVLPDDAIMEEDCERRDLAGRLRTLVRDLPPRDARILILRYGLDGRGELTQQAVAERLGISRSYVSRIEKRALETLRRRWEDQWPAGRAAAEGKKKPIPSSPKRG